MIVIGVKRVIIEYSNGTRREFSDDCVQVHKISTEWTGTPAGSEPVVYYTITAWPGGKNATRQGVE